MRVLMVCMVDGTGTKSCTSRSLRTLCVALVADPVVPTVGCSNPLPPHPCPGSQNDLTWWNIDAQAEAVGRDRVSGWGQRL